MTNPSQMHTCHAIDCDTLIPPHLHMCKKHWYMVPLILRRRIWNAYRKGQEIDKLPSIMYIEAAKDSINAVAVKEGKIH